MSVLEARRGQEHSPSVPQIIYDKTLNDPDVPYTVSIDAEACGAFLQTFGMKERKIPSRVIELRRTLAGGHYGKNKGKKMILACDTIWKNLSTGYPSWTINTVLQHEGKHAIDSSQPHRHPQDMVYKSIIVGSGLIVLPLLALSTDLSIAEDFFFSTATEAVWFMGVGAYISSHPNHRSPWEKRAYAFTDKIKDDPRWHNLIAIIPKAV